MSKSSGRRPALALLFAVSAIALLSACSTSTPVPTPTATAPAPTATPPATVAGKVVAVVDGATIDVKVAGEVYRVRYLGIDVPGTGIGEDPALATGALEFNRFKVLDRVVELERGGLDVDDAGRLLRYVYVDGEMVNRAMLEGGYAVVAGFPAEFPYRDSFIQSEAAARQDGRGYWHKLDERNVSAEDLRPTPVPTEAPRFFGGTLPLPPGAGGETCDFTGTQEAVIKGNVNSATGERVYILPSSLFYATTVVDPDDGDAWLCTEAEAIAAGWAKAKH